MSNADSGSEAGMSRRGWSAGSPSHRADAVRPCGSRGDGMTQLAPDPQWGGSMLERTQEEWDVLSSEWKQAQAGLADRVIEHLAGLDQEKSVFPLTRLGHSLQVATRASRAGRDDEYVFCALLHDIGDTLATYNHADLGAAIVKPFVRPAYHWMVQKHDVFQGYFFWHFVGRDRNAREEYRGH